MEAQSHRLPCEIDRCPSHVSASALREPTGGRPASWRRNRWRYLGHPVHGGLLPVQRKWAMRPERFHNCSDASAYHAASLIWLAQKAPRAAIRCHRGKAGSDQIVSQRDTSAIRGFRQKAADQPILAPVFQRPQILSMSIKCLQPALLALAHTFQPSLVCACLPGDTVAVYGTGAVDTLSRETDILWSTKLVKLASTSDCAFFCLPLRENGYEYRANSHVRKDPGAQKYADACPCPTTDPETVVIAVTPMTEERLFPAGQHQGACTSRP